MCGSLLAPAGGQGQSLWKVHFLLFKGIIWTLLKLYNYQLPQQSSKACALLAPFSRRRVCGGRAGKD